MGKPRRDGNPAPVRYCKRTGKRVFSSDRKARKHMRMAGNRVRTYRCEFCGGVHVTSQAYEQEQHEW